MICIGYFDLETTDLKADVGRLLCGSVLDQQTGKICTFRQDQIKRKKSMADDGEIARLIRMELERFHILVGWNSKGFDIPFLDTRLLANDIPTLRPSLHLDIMWYFKGWRGFLPRNAKLATVVELLESSERKMDLDVKVWVEAAGGDKVAMDQIAARCESDVRLLTVAAAAALTGHKVRNIESYP